MTSSCSCVGHSPPCTTGIRASAVGSGSSKTQSLLRGNEEGEERGELWFVFSDHCAVA